jgi:hypothetical protein
MNDHSAPLNKETCDRIHPELYADLLALGVTKVLDRGDFRRVRGYTPCCSSIFLVGDNPGGSYDYHTREGVEVVTHNGTLMTVGGRSINGLSKKYEEVWHGAPPPDPATEVTFMVRLVPTQPPNTESGGNASPADSDTLFA